MKSRTCTLAASVIAAAVAFPIAIAPAAGAAPYTVPDDVNVAFELEYAQAELARKQQAYDAALAELRTAQANVRPDAAGGDVAKLEAELAEAKASYDRLKAELDAESQQLAEKMERQRARGAALEAAGDTAALEQFRVEWRALGDEVRGLRASYKQLNFGTGSRIGRLEAQLEQAKADAAATAAVDAAQLKADRAREALEDERRWIESLTNAQQGR